MFAALFVLLMTSTISRADMPLSQVITEEMIEHEGDAAGFLGLAFGPDASSPLQFSSNTNFAGMSFSYALNGGSTYLGQSLSLLGQGSFNPVTDVMSLSSSGQLGSQAFTILGQDQVTFNADGSVSGAADFNFYFQGVKAYDRHRRIRLYSDGTSTDVGYYTDKNGQKIPNSDFDSVDVWDLIKGNWGYNEAGNDGLTFLLASSGYSPINGGDGTFTAAISNVPEPASLLLMGSAAVGLFAKLRGTVKP
jgi:hypothetical protein